MSDKAARVVAAAKAVFWVATSLFGAHLTVLGPGAGAVAFGWGALGSPAFLSWYVRAFGWAEAEERLAYGAVLAALVLVFASQSVA